MFPVECEHLESEKATQKQAKTQKTQKTSKLRPLLRQMHFLRKILKIFLKTPFSILVSLSKTSLLVLKELKWGF